jgi:hypothetical protein
MSDFDLLICNISCDLNLLNTLARSFYLFSLPPAYHHHFFAVEPLAKGKLKELFPHYFKQ